MPSKGPATPEATERTYPYIVEMLVPEGGFGRKLAPATEYKPSAGAAAAKEDFADPGIAVDFADEFGGQSATDTPIDRCKPSRPFSRR